MKKLLLATHNLHKLQEIKQITEGKFEVLGLDDLGFTEEIPETSPSIEGNAIQKVRYLFERFPMNCFADDTGLEVEALDGAPGVYSARYAGEHCSFEDNINKLLLALRRVDNRKARFRSVIALIFEGKLHTFEGIIHGKIQMHRDGTGGFGYDPVFVPDGYEVTFAAMEPTEKNRISHRGIATQKLLAFLNEPER